MKLKNYLFLSTIMIILFLLIMPNTVNATAKANSIQDLVQALGNNNVSVNGNTIKLENDVILDDGIILEDGDYTFDLNGKIVNQKRLTKNN